MAELLKRLSEANGVSGNETAVREIIAAEIKNDIDDIIIDSMGNLIAYKKGADSSKAIAVTVNTDEAGFIVSGITDKGYIKFKPVGNIDPRKIISKRVNIGGKIKGVIGMKAIHLQTKSERENVVPVSKLFIDIGAKNKADAEKNVNLGDYVTFDTEFEAIGAAVKGKALERSGECRALIQALKENYPYDVYACFLAQSEVGARGAFIASHRLNVDAVLTVSAADTTDMHGCETESGGTALGDGAVVNYSDKTAIADRNLTDRMIKLARREKIKVRERALKNAVGDLGAMQTGGAVSLGVVIPCRYSRSPVSIMSRNDITAATEYISLFLNRIGDMI